MSADFKYDVFLSHSSKDELIVSELADRQKKDGLRVWYAPRDIRPGDSFPKKIEVALERSRILVFCMSEHTKDSDWTDLEVQAFIAFVLQDKRRRIIALRLDETPIRGILRPYQYVDYQQCTPDQYRTLLNACREDPSETVAVDTSDDTATSGRVCRVLADMGEAFRELESLDVTFLRATAYVNRTVAEHLLRKHNRRNLPGLKIRFLLRDPETDWLHPPSGTRRYASRVGEVRAYKLDFEGHQESEVMLHRQPGYSGLPFCAFTPTEPTMRAVLAETISGKRILYYGFYPLQPRGQGDDQILDFSGTGSPVVRIEADGTNAGKLVDDFTRWFDFMWDLHIERSKLERAVGRDNSGKPVFALDFDGVIADTGKLKMAWIKKNLNMVVPATLCNRTQCVTRIGEAHYNRMSLEVYSRDETLRTQPVAGAIPAIKALASECTIIVITARTADNACWAEEWLRAHRLGDAVAAVLHKESFRKIDIAARSSALALLDDDIRHLRPVDHPTIQRGWFSSDKTSDTLGNIQRVGSWKSAKKWLVDIAEQYKQHKKK